MTSDDRQKLRRGWTTGACATAATRAALLALWGGERPATVSITLPGGETPAFEVLDLAVGSGWAEAAIIKDAGDDPDVTHGAKIAVRVDEAGSGLQFAAGPGVGTVTRAGLPIPVGEPSINPKPREMIAAAAPARPAMETRIAVFPFRVDQR